MIKKYKLVKPIEKTSKIKTFIYKFKYKYILVYAKFKDIYNVSEKKRHITLLLIDILSTGGIIYYIVHHNNIISYGLLAYLITYYFEWAVNIVKRQN